MRNLSVIVIGAGLGGLTAALALQRAGHRVKVHEQAPSLGEIGAGVMLTPNATRILIKLGLGDAIRSHGIVPAYTAVRDAISGRELSNVSIGDSLDRRHGAPYYHIHRADLHTVLSKAVLDADPDAIALGRPFTGAETYDCDLMIGADGIKSRVRSLVAGDVPTQFTGNVAWRGLVPMERLRPEIRQNEAIIWVGPKRHIVRYGVRGGAVMNYVALAEQEAWQDEGWNVRADVADVLKEFTGWHPDVVDILRNTPADACFKWGLFDRAPLPTWIKGNVVLLGDAAHPMLPFMAQGAATSMEDAAALTTILGRHPDLAGALKAYEVERLPRTAWIQQQSRANQKLYHDNKSGADFDEDRALRSQKLYDYDAFAA
jgi:salicylate hydroxylase